VRPGNCAGLEPLSTDPDLPQSPDISALRTIVVKVKKPDFEDKSTGPL
jgi:hypothetical protein